MNTKNDKQRTTRENYWEPKKNLWTNQGKTNENHRKTHGKPKKENEKQWKTKDNYASILFFFFAGFFRSRFFEFSIFNGEKNKKHFEGTNDACLRCLGSCMFTKPRKYAVNCIFSLHMCFKRNYFYVCCFWGTLMEENTLHGENLACHFIPKICILYGNTVVRLSAHWNLEYSWPAF